MPTDINLSQDTIALFQAIENNDGVECEKAPFAFFPEDLYNGQKMTKTSFKQVKDMEETAREICFKCPVISLCLKVGLYEDYGIWGGTTPQQRKLLRKEKQI